MKKQVLISFLFFLSLTIMAQDKKGTYENEWKKIEAFQADALPQSASKEVEVVLKKAIADNNSQQVIKALIYKNKYQIAIDQSDNQGLIKELEALLLTSKDVTDKAMLHSMLGELYYSNYDLIKYSINRRTPLVGQIPADMTAWSKNIYVDKIIENLNQSIKVKDELSKTETKKYGDLVLLSKNKETQVTTLYDFLMLRAIAIAKELNNNAISQSDIETSTGLSIEQLTLPAKDFVKLTVKNPTDEKNLIFSYYNTYLTHLLNSDANLHLLIASELARLDVVKGGTIKFDTEKYIKALNTLLAQYKDKPESVEIVSTLVSVLQQKDNNRYSHRYIAVEEDENNNENRIKVYNLLTQYIEKFPTYNRIYLLKDKLANIENSAVSLKLNALYYPTSNIEVAIKHKNLQALSTSSGFMLFKMIDGTYQHIKDYTPKLTSELSYTFDQFKLPLGTLEVGSYKLAFVQNTRTYDSMENKLQVATKKGNANEFVVTALSSFSRKSAKNACEIFVVDRLTGKPISNATVNIRQLTKTKGDREKSLVSKLTTNNLGLATFVDKETKEGYNDQYIYYTVEVGEDKYLSESNLNIGVYNYRLPNETEDEESKPTISFFTDRSIYRPGQIVFYKAIVLDKKGKPIKGYKSTIRLTNNNGEEVALKSLTTNEFGSVAGDFVLPQSGLLGWYSIADVEVGNSSVAFSVEEYKRPTFQITFDKIKETYTFDQAITIKGHAKTFSGISLQNTEVNYNINRRDAFPFFFASMQNEHWFNDGRVTTDDNGDFSITFVPTNPDRNLGFFRSQIYAFDINTTITNLSGETQSGNHSIVVGNVSMLLIAEVPNQVEQSDSSKISINAINLQGEKINAKGTYTLYKLDDKDSIQSTALTGSFDTGLQAQLRSDLKSLQSGKYRLQLKAPDDRQTEVTNSTDFVLFSYADKKPPIKTNTWIVHKNVEFGKNKSAEIVFGTSQHNKYILYQVYNNEKVFERKFINLSDKNQLFRLPYKEEYGKEVYVNFTSVKEDEFTNNRVLVTLTKEVPDTKLEIKLKTFRDKLRPGQEETWSVSIADTKGKPVVAELLASMYDLSLDQIAGYTSWNIARPYKDSYQPYPADFTYGVPYYKLSSYFNAINLEYLPSNKEERKGYTYDQLNWFGYPMRWIINNFVVAQHNNMLRGMGTYSRAAKQSIIQEDQVVNQADAGSVQESREDRSIEFAPPAGIEAPMDAPAPEPQIRKNFNETAFFYPQLRTNEEGETLVSFTVPESNTTWRFRMLAHDKEAREGTTEKMVVTSKELMVTPNMPRFLRQGDKASISTLISNLSDNDMAGKVVLEFFDPITEKTIDIIDKKISEQTFALEQGKSSSATWSFDVPTDVDMIGCRIVATSGNFSDGEQHALSVLPNRMLVTETMPFDVSVAGQSKFVFDKMANFKSKTLTHHRLTLEYATNPAWYAVLALPTMSNPTNENAVNWFASFYVNSMGKSIATQHPKVANMIKAWKQQGGTKETLVSKLNKNEELKNILLEETPWVLDAKNESEQMERLSQLFDSNNTEQLTQKAINKLIELQTSEGGWMWYRGLYSNRPITLYILKGLSDLQLVGQIEYPSQVKEMQMRALKYVDEELVKEFTNIKKSKDWENITSVRTLLLEQMYIRSNYRDVPISQEAREAERFYTNVASKNWTKLGLYPKAILSMLVKRNGEKELAMKITNSIREHSKTDSSLGMYWPNNTNHVLLSMSAANTHVSMMEALKENGATDAEMDLMKKWLIKQKQTQLWETTHATINVINTLLKTGTDWYTAQANNTTIKVANKTIDTKDSELGTGYIKQSWTGKEIDKNMAKVTIDTDSKTASYGSLYWQYYEELDKITTQGGDMNISKELYRKAKGDKGEILVPITTNEPITIGDQVIVRLTLRANRDLEFVHLKDMRASCFEPLNTLSGTKWNNGMLYYQTTKDASTNFYIDNLRKGTYVLEYPVYAARSGEYSNGITTLQCLYAPEFASHTAGIKVTVKEK